MKSEKDIHNRISQLEKSQKNWVDNTITINLLNKIIDMSSEDITTLLQLNIDYKNYQVVRELIWILE